jgi:hypothetical protein
VSNSPFDDFSFDNVPIPQKEVKAPPPKANKAKAVKPKGSSDGFVDLFEEEAPSKPTRSPTKSPTKSQAPLSSQVLQDLLKPVEDPLESIEDFLKPRPSTPPTPEKKEKKGFFGRKTKETEKKPATAKEAQKKPATAKETEKKPATAKEAQKKPAKEAEKPDGIPASPSSPQEVMGLRLMAPLLKYYLNGAEYNHYLTQEVTYLGRSEQATISIPIKEISKVHCRITRIGRDWFIEDCKSTKGTFFKGEALLRGEKAQIKENCEFLLGDLPIEFYFPVLKDAKASSKEENASKRIQKAYSKALFSIIVHLVFFIGVSQIIVIESSPPQKPPYTVSLPEPAPEVEPEKEILPPEEIIKKEKKEIEEPQQDVEFKEEMDSPEEFEVEEPNVDENTVVDKIDSQTKEVTDFSMKLEAVTGIGGSSASRHYNSRFGTGKRKGLNKHGGGNDTESSANHGLLWLKRHQDPNGYWDGITFRNQCYEKQCRRVTNSSTSYREAVTAFALLAFLGAGHTEDEGRFKDVVSKGVRYLESVQGMDGSYGEIAKDKIYTHAAVTLALSEAYQFRRGSKRKAQLERALSYILTSQKVGSGWRYTPKPANCDTSVTTWCVMAIKSAKYAKLEVPEEAFEGARKWFDYATDPVSFMVGYDSPARTNITMTATAIASRFFLGYRPDHESIENGIKHLSANLPIAEEGEKINYYYWYYGTIAMFQYGQEPWEKWNAALKKTLLPIQKRSGCEKGSWDPNCLHFDAGERVLVTSIAVLILEIYYRYPRVFK